MLKKNITPSSRAKLATGQAIDDLAIMVKKGFDGVDKRFDGVDKQFTEVYKRFDNVETRLSKIERGIFNHEHRIEKLEDEVVDIKGLLAIK